MASARMGQQGAPTTTGHVGTGTYLSPVGSALRPETGRQRARCVVHVVLRQGESGRGAAGLPTDPTRPDQLQRVCKLVRHQSPGSAPYIAESDLEGMAHSRQEA